MHKMTFDEFRNDVMFRADCCPDSWRKGQAVFNTVDSVYGVARYVQFEKGIDCFYMDDLVEDFIKAAYEVIANEQETN